MAGHTGKRARRPAPCRKCGKPINDTKFMRERDGSYHETCWWESKAESKVTP